MGSFSNPDPSKEPKNLWGFLKWKLISRKPKWPRKAPLQDDTDVPPLKVGNNKIRISLVGHVSFLIQTHALNILTDPVWGNIIGHKRVSKPGIRFQDLPKIDIVLISHNHYDHMDIPTLKKLYLRDKPHFIVPLKNEIILQKKIPGVSVTTLNWQEFLPITEDLSIHLEPAQHWSRRGLFDMNKALWGTFMIKTSKGSICFIGDTGYDPSLFREIGQKYSDIVVSLIPIGAFEPRWFMRDVHVNPEEAVLIHQDLKSKNSIASHFETFQLADDTFQQAAFELNKARKKFNISEEEFITPRIAGVYWFDF